MDDDKKIDVQARLDLARAAVAVLRSLHLTGGTMRYGQLARAIGLIADGDAWQPWHRQQVRDILVLIAATEHQAGKNVGSEQVHFECIVNEHGQPGTGFYKTSRIETSVTG